MVTFNPKLITVTDKQAIVDEAFYQNEGRVTFIVSAGRAGRVVQFVCLNVCASVTLNCTFYA